jgi:Pyridoxamine 5'-phosphate oxidase
MDKALQQKILELLDQHRLMTVATNRPDGWPQATTVGYVTIDTIRISFFSGGQIDMPYLGLRPKAVSAAQQVDIQYDNSES